MTDDSMTEPTDDPIISVRTAALREALQEAYEDGFHDYEDQHLFTPGTSANGILARLAAAPAPQGDVRAAAEEAARDYVGRPARKRPDVLWAAHFAAMFWFRDSEYGHEFERTFAAEARRLLAVPPAPEPEGETR